MTHRLTLSPGANRVSSIDRNAQTQFAAPARAPAKLRRRRRGRQDARPSRATGIATGREGPIASRRRGPMFTSVAKLAIGCAASACRDGRSGGSMKLFRAVAWDIDGTLIDSEPLHQRAIVAASAALGVDLSDIESGAFRGVHALDIWQALGPRFPPGAKFEK